jgi:hypothetical protein
MSELIDLKKLGGIFLKGSLKVFLFKICSPKMSFS